MINKEDILNSLIKDNDCTSYLELGYQHGYNFNRIECDNKVSVDINGHADFNDGDLAFFEHNNKQTDAIFIDSNHEAEHVRKVIKESMKCNPKFIALHDACPRTKESQMIPRVQREFCGTVWRAVVGFIQTYPDIRVETYRSDHGLTVIYPEGKKIRKNFENMEMTYEEFKENETNLLNIIY